MNHERRLNFLIGENVGLLNQGTELIGSLDAETYRNNEHEYFRSGIGKHFRHVLDFYDSFIRGWRDTIDYDSRGRDANIESDPDYAIRAARTLAGALESIAGEIDTMSGHDTATVVRTEVQDGEGTAINAESTVERELSVLASHTVHHYAIIGMLARLQGVQVDHSFGVAPSTLRYLAGRK